MTHAPPPQPPPQAPRPSESGTVEVPRHATGVYLAWNVAVPAAIGFIPIAIMQVIQRPPYPSFDPFGWLVLLMLPAGGLVTGRLGLRRGAVYVDVAMSLWIAQSLALWLSTCSDITSSASCGPGAGMPLGLVGLAFAGVLAGLLGGLPLYVAFRYYAHRSDRR